MRAAGSRRGRLHTRTFRFGKGGSDPLIAQASFTALALAVGLSFAPARAEERAPSPEEIVQMWVESADYSPSARTLDVRMRVEIAEGWHINARQPSLPTLIPTTLAVEPPEGFTVGEIQYPEPVEVPFRFAGGQRLRVYRGAFRLRVPLSLSHDLTPEGVSFNAKLRYQACNDSRCLRPAEVERAFVVKSPSASSGSSAPAALGNGMPVERWLASRGLAATLSLVFLMGLALNLTPCVYPLISVTLAYFGGQARDRRGRVVFLAAIYALGIAITFSVLGVSAALSGGLFGRALQHPATLVAIASLMVVLALSSFGAYSLQPPAWLLRRVGRSSTGATGAFLMGLTMGIVAAPCVGPIVVGLLVAVGARGDPVLGFVLFFTLAVGLGAPYVILGAAAGSLAQLPRSGEWLVWVEHLFGFVLLGMALYFLRPLLPAALVGWLVPPFLAAAGVVLGFLDPNGRELRYFPLLKRALGAVALAAGLWTALPSAPNHAIAWQPFSDTTLDGARVAHRPAVIDFRADWCLPCLEMERSTFVAADVVKRAGEFSWLRADVTEDSPQNQETLSRYEVLGVPTTIFYDRAGKENRRVIGYISPRDFVRLLEETLDAS